MLCCEDLTVAYHPSVPPVLDGFSTRFQQGRFTALNGPNGCGKSTLLKAIMGFLPRSGGRITLDGAEISDIPRRTLATRIAYLPQENYCPDYINLAELVELGGYSRYSWLGGPSDKDRDLFNEILATVGLEGMGHVQVNALSGGQRQRAWIAMILAQNADIILLDEPVNHLDLKYQYAVLEMVRDLVRHRNKTVIAVLHDLNLTAGFAQDVVMLNAGAVVAEGDVEAAITAETVQQVYGMQADVFERDGRLVCLPKQRAALREASA